MKIWAHTLFKNEERWLWFSVTSVIDHVDKLLLWDTGSTDNSWKIATLLKSKYSDKIDLRQYGAVNAQTFSDARQAMLDETRSDWFMVVDGDEIWWDENIKKLIENIKNEHKAESFIMPTINLVGEIYHYQDKSAGKYKFGTGQTALIGHYNLRAIKRAIPGLHSKGHHGVWGWADKEGKQVQDRNTFKYINAPYLHASFLPRGGGDDDFQVPKRLKKLKHEIGESVPLDYYYPEVFFENRPDFIPSPWQPMTSSYKLKAIIQTPLRKINRFLFTKTGY